MTGDVAAACRAAAAAWRRDRAVLAPLSGLFLFVPQYAVLLLVPELPRLPADATGPAAVQAWSDRVAAWMEAHGGGYLAAMLLVQFGGLAVMALYAGGGRGTAGGALAQAARLYPRFLLATVLVSLPLGLGALLAMGLPGGLLLVLAPVIYVLGRSCLAGPVILAERGTGAVAALARSWRLTRGRGLPLALLVGALTLGGQLAGGAIVGIERMMRAAGIGTPLAVAAIDAPAAGATWAAGLALALVQAALYARLAR